MAERRNPPRRVRRKLTHAANGSSDSTPRLSDDDSPMGYTSWPERSLVPASKKSVDRKLLMCLDYGTAFTSVSYITFDPKDPPRDVVPGAIKSVRDWPQARGHFDVGNACVPSESWYRNGQYVWGHAVQQILRTLSEEDDVNSTNCIIQLPKLLLDDEGDGSSEDPLLGQKIALRNVDKTAREAIQDYLVEVFSHAREQLRKQEGFNDGWEVELALCVPSKWSTYAHLTMQEIVLGVVDETNMGGKAFSIFIVDEPEAAVTFALRHDPVRDEIENDSNFIVCDAGGGTVDAITYRVRQDNPFRFDEIATPAGKDCGSSYINQALCEESKHRLKDVTVLGSETIYSKEAVIQHDIFRAFEQEVKRTYDPAKFEEGERISLRMWGLRADASRNFGHGIFFITKDQMNNYFRRSLDGTVDLINEQLDQVDRTKVKVLLLVGGFSRSPALRRRLQEDIEDLKLVHLGDDIDMDTAVSRGGVLRALDKENGPRRKLRLNLGVCANEEYEPRHKGHKAGPWFDHPVNGKRYVNDCIDWVIRKDRVLGEKATAQIHMYRVFEMEQEMIAQETLYFSDRRIHNHYPIDHWKNEGLREAGVVKGNLSDLRDKNMIEPKVNEKGKMYYEVGYVLKLEVNGHNVKATIECGRKIHGEAQICIAAAFKPGTK